MHLCEKNNIKLLFTGSIIYGEELSDVVAGIQVSAIFNEICKLNNKMEDEKMSKEKSLFEQMGDAYTEKDGILYPNILIENLVFVITRNIPVSQNDTDLVMKVISDQIAKEHEKFKPLTPHTLRHTFTTRCIERGMNQKTVQVILEHSSVNIT